jgi:outer membrane receptor protein involved in Fe transport
MNQLFVSFVKKSVGLRPAQAVLLAAALIPASLFGQTANPPPAQPDQTTAQANQPPVPVTTTAASQTTGETVSLSPFEVNATQAQGYFTPNTTTGTRLANNIGDIPSSVTVIDKQQIENTGAQNINDIMMYEAGTEGSRTYTQATGFSESTRVDDVLAGTNDTQTTIGGLNTSTTRVNGLGIPDNEVDDFYGLYRIPFDTYNVQSIEIDRGPNSLMFGSGSAAGIVNASSNEAQLDKLSGDASLQGSSFGGYRETSDINIPLIRNKVAVYLAQEYTSVGIQRKPSSDLTRRQYATITIDPFKSHKTKLTAYAEFYNNYANDENSLLPTDEVTPWIAAGKPIFNPVTQMLTDLATGKVLGPYTSSTTSPNYVAGNPTGTSFGSSTNNYALYQPGIGAASNNFTEIFGPNGQYLYGFQPQQTLGSNYGGLIPAQVPTTPLTAAQAMVRSEFMTTSAALPIPGVGTPGTPVSIINGVTSGGYASWITPGIVDQGIYNSQTGPNYYGTDYTQSEARTYHLDFQQNILSSSKWGSLDLDVAFLRQEYHDSEVTPDNQHNNDAIFVDTNSYLLNGMPNAYAGSVLFYDHQGDAFQQPEVDQNWRGMLTYAIDLRDKLPQWLQFLGHHRFMAEASTHDDIKQDIRFRTVINGGDGSYTSELYQLNNQPVIPGNWNVQEGQDPYRWQYFSAPGSQVMNQPPSLYGIPNFGSQPTSITATTYNYQTGQWVNSGLTVASPAFNGPQITENVQDQKTYYWQSFFWNDRIVGSIGLNDDIVKNRSAGTIYNAIINGVPTATTNNAGLVSYVNGVPNPNLKYDLSQWNPTTHPNVFQPGTNQLAQQTLGEVGGNTYSEGFVFRPFENWSGIDAAANDGNIIAGVLRTLGLTFNKADNFNPPTGTFTDLLGNPLGKPTGTEKDYGLEVATPDKKLYVRMTWFKSSNQNNISGVSQTLTARELYIDQNDMVQWSEDVVALESGENPTSTQFGNQTVFPLSASQYQAAAALTGLNVNYLTSGGNTITGGYSNPEATNTYSADGVDLELTYNPLPNWTMKFTGSRQAAQLSAVDLQAKAYQAVRLPYWTTASAPAAYNVVYTNYKGLGSTSTADFGSFWSGWGFGTDTSDADYPVTVPATVGNYYNGVVTIPITVEEAAQGTDVPELTPYTWNFLTNYQFVSGPLKNLGVGGGLRWLSSTVEGYYGATQASLLNATGQVAADDITKPIYNPAELHADAWISYGFKLPFDDGKIKCTVQLNCVDLTSNGYIQAIQYNLDGSPAVYRVFPPRQWSLTTRFSF